MNDKILLSKYFRGVDFMKKKFMMFLLVMTCFLSCCKVVYGLTPPPKIGGNIYLPEGKVAPPGGINLKVIAETKDSVLTYEGTIKEGENSTSYWFTVLTMAGGMEIRCELITPVEDYYDVSYYTGSTQKPFKSDAVKLTNMMSSSDYNITLVEGKKVKGEIILPDVMTVQKDSTVTLNFIARSETLTTGDEDPYFSKDVEVVIKEGEKSGIFEVNLPIYSDGYYYNYRLNDYISGVCPNYDVFDLNNKLTDEEFLRITLDKGNVIKGKISLPKGEVAGKEGLPVNMSAIYYTQHNSIGGLKELPNYIERQIIIPEGENSIDYEITVYPKYSKYYMQYRLDKNTHVYKGYYSQGGTITTLDKEKCAFEVTKDVDGIDLSVLNGVKLSGKILCPEGESATEDYSGILTLYNTDHLLDYEYVINRGSSFATFEFIVPEDLEDFVLRYEVYISKYVGIGFYNENGTTSNNATAQLLSAKNSVIDNIQFYLLQNVTITGKVCIPDNHVSIEDSQVYKVDVLAKNANGTYDIINYYFCHILPGEKSSSFEMIIPGDYKEVILSCSEDLNSDIDLPLMTFGYLGEDGMVLTKDKAKVINPYQLGSTDIELVPIKGVRISGIFTFDNEHRYLKEDKMYIGYSVLSEDGQSTGVSEELYWPDKVADSQKYHIEIPSKLFGKNFIITFFSGDSETFYLADEGLTEDLSKAKIFKVDGIDIKNLDIYFDNSSFVLYGDVNNDREINSLDLAKLKGYLLGKFREDEIKAKNADLNLDGYVNSLDYALLRKYLLGKIRELPDIPNYPGKIIISYDFEDNKLGGWILSTTDGGKADYEVVDGKLKLSIQEPGEQTWSISLEHKLPLLTERTPYVIQFNITSTKYARLYARIGEYNEPYTDSWNNNWQAIDLYPNKTVKISQKFWTTNLFSEQQLSFSLGGPYVSQVPLEIYFDDIEIRQTF